MVAAGSIDPGHFNQVVERQHILHRSYRHPVICCHIKDVYLQNSFRLYPAFHNFRLLYHHIPFAGADLQDGFLVLVQGHFFYHLAFGSIVQEKLFKDCLLVYRGQFFIDGIQVRHDTVFLLGKCLYFQIQHQFQVQHPLLPIVVGLCL